DAYRDLDTRIDVLVFSRLTDATESASKAVELYRSRSAVAGRDSSATTAMLNAMTMQLQLMYQHAVSLSGYTSAPARVPATGDSGLVANLSNALRSRSGGVDAEIQDLERAAAGLLAEADEMTNSLPAGGPDESDDPRSALETQLDAVRTGLDNLP